MIDGTNLYDINLLVAIRDETVIAYPESTEKH
jgi:hypothetical protein